MPQRMIRKGAAGQTGGFTGRTGPVSGQVGFALKFGGRGSQYAETSNVMTFEPSSPVGSRQSLGLAWSIPVLLLVYIGLGYWLGGLLGSKIAGTLVGWLAGMGAVFYEIRKVLRGQPPKGGAD